MPDFDSAIQRLKRELVDLRHELHAHPELGFEEKWTAARLLQELEPLPGLELRSGLAKTGIEAVLNRHKLGPCVLLRADMDALPIQEDHPGLEYASTIPGKMHACGHDGHMSCLIGAAKVLTHFSEDLPGKVKFIFQPAEEGGGGGGKLVDEEGVLENPDVDAAFGLHGWPDVEVGQVMVGSGPVLAAATAFSVTLNGTGAHAAYPHTGNDVILAAAHTITALQAISSRWDPVDPVLVSVTMVQAGHTHNVLPGTCRLMGTVRGLAQESHDQVMDKVRHIVGRSASVFGCTGDVEFKPGYPALHNDAKCAAFVSRIALELLDHENVVTDPPPGMGGEDFSFFARRVPATWFRVGVKQPGQPDCPALHSPNYNFADEAIGVGVRMFCEIAHRYLHEGLQA